MVTDFKTVKEAVSSKKAGKSQAKTKKPVTLETLISMGMNKGTHRVSEAYLTLIAERSGNAYGLVEAKAKDLGAVIYKEDPVNFDIFAASRIQSLTHEQDCLLADAVQNPERYGQDMADAAMVALHSAYSHHAEYEVVKSGLMGLFASDSAKSGSADREDAESDTKIAMIETIKRYDPTCGYKLITCIARKSSFYLKDKIREGKYKDNHGMNRNDQKIVKFIKENPATIDDPVAIAHGIGVDKEYVIKYLTKTNGAAVCDQSYEVITENKAKGKRAQDDVHGETDFVEEDWAFSDDDTEADAIKGSLFGKTKYIFRNALDDTTKELIFRVIVNGETKKEVCKELEITTERGSSLIDEGLKLMGLYFRLNGYDKDTVVSVLAM